MSPRSGGFSWGLVALVVVATRDMEAPEAIILRVQAKRISHPLRAWLQLKSSNSFARMLCH